MTEIIPAIDLRNGRCVRLYQGNFEQRTEYAASPAALARKYEDTGVEHLHIVDLDGARLGQQKNAECVRQIIDATKLHVQLGGGIREEADAKACFASGVSRVVIGSLAITAPDQISEWLWSFGPEKIVLAFDVNLDSDGTPHVATHGWTSSTDVTLWRCIEHFLTVGVRHVLCTDISRDGALSGPNINLYAEIVRRYPELQLQSSGGIRGLGDIHALRDVNVPAAIIGRALLEGKISAKEISSCLRGA